MGAYSQLCPEAQSIRESWPLSVSEATRSAGEFTLSMPEVLARQTYKWQRYPPGIIASCVADMDFRIPPQVQAVIQRGVEISDFSYPLRNGSKADRAVAWAFAARMKEVCGWEVDPCHVLVLADLVQATYASILAFSEPGDGVIVQVPSYPPIREAVESTGRRLIPFELKRSADSYIFDVDELAELIDARTRIFVLCNPQNPTGRVFSRAELAAVVALAEKHDLLIVSDEVHSDLVYPGERHIPIAALSAAAAARTITLNSATKSFNIPGLRCAAACFGSEALMQRFHERIPVRLTGAVNTIGIDATVAAWTRGQPWLDAVLEHLLSMRDYVTETLHREIPDINFLTPEATYLLWMDCSALDLPGSAYEFFLKRARVGFYGGEHFHPPATQFVRMNFATSKVILDEVLERMIGAVREHRG